MQIQKKKFKFKFVLWKSYFDKGMGLTNYVKYFIAFFSLASRDVKKTILLALIYAAMCLIIGWAWYHYRFMDVEAEVGNIFNPFVREMRKAVRKRKV